MVILDVVDQLFEEIARIICLENVGGDVRPVNVMVVVSVELVSEWSFNLVEIEYFNDVGLLSLP